MCLRSHNLFKKSKQTATNCTQILEKWEKMLFSLKRILALPAQGQGCTVSVLQPFSFDEFQSKHPISKIKCVQFWNLWLKNWKILSFVKLASIAQWQSTGLVNQGSWVQTSLEANNFFLFSKFHFCILFLFNFTLI